jgi:hypothetical protein
MFSGTQEENEHFSVLFIRNISFLFQYKKNWNMMVTEAKYIEKIHLY